MKAYIDQVFIFLSQSTGWLWCVVVLFGTAALAALIWQAKPKRRTRWLVIVGGSGIALAAILVIPYALMASRYRVPHGPFRVQQAILVLPAGGSDRFAAPILMQIWYPTATALRPTPRLDNCAALQSLALAAANNARRLILYMPHLAGRRDDNSTRLSYLASFGYVAVAFDDIAQDPKPVDARPEEEAERFEKGIDYTQEDYERTIGHYNNRVRRQAEKALSGLGRLAACASANTASPWSNGIDYAHVGFLGFSFGGSTATEAAAIDNRIVAVVNLDGLLFGQAFEGHASVPYLFVRSGRPFSTMRSMMSKDPVERYLSRIVDRDLREEVRLTAQLGSAGILIKGSAHLDLSDAVFEPHASRLWLFHNPIAFYNAVNLYTRDFFDARLMGKPAFLVGQRSSPIPVVQSFREIGLTPGGNGKLSPLQDANGAPI